MPRSPIGRCISVNWDNAIEFLPLHPQGELPSAFETVEYWREAGKWVRYRPRIKKTQSETEVRYELTYAPEDHRGIKVSDVEWGTSTIAIDVARKNVCANWESANNPENNGSACVRLVDQSRRARTKARPTVRNQSDLRKLLLDTDGVCAITGECTEPALECAHIVPVENEGFETDSNAILLRADLHCLYDSRDFEISPEGRVVRLSAKLSECYRNLLDGKRLDNELTRRVTISLAQRNAKPRRSE